MSANNDGQKRDDLGILADIVADVRADVPSQVQWERARQNLVARLDSHRDVTRSDTATADQSISESRLGGVPRRRRLAAGVAAACAVVAAVVVAAFALYRPQGPVVTARPVGQVQCAYGPSFRVREGRSSDALSSGEKLWPGDQLRVGLTGTLELYLADGSVLSLRPGTVVECVGPRSATAAVVRLHRGDMRANIAQNPNAPFRIWTPAGSLRVLGTEFDVRVLPDITQEAYEETEAMTQLRSTLQRAILAVSVLTGSVAVEAIGNEQVVKEGQRTLVADRSAPADSERLHNLDYLRKWLGQESKDAKVESLAFVPIRKDLLHSLVATDTESGTSRRIADFVGCIPQVVEQVGPDLAVVKASSVIFAHFGNQPISGAGRPLVNDQVMLVNLTTGEKLSMLPLKDCDPLYMQLSPDRRKLAFVGHRDVDDSDEPEFGLFVLDLETFDLKRLLAGALKTAPHWSPDSRWLAISNSPGYQDHHEIVLIDVMTREVVETGLMGAGVYFSPDGKHLVFSSGIKQSGSWSAGVPTWGNLFIAGVRERESKQLTHLTDGGAKQPSFSPDGSRLLYWQAAKNRSGAVRLHEIDMNSREDRVITEGGRFGTCRWLNANSRVLLTYTELATNERSKETLPVAKVKLIDLAGESPVVREFTPKAERASVQQSDTASDLSDRLFRVFVLYRDAVKDQDLHRLEEAQVKYAKARDLLEAISRELEDPKSQTLQKGDLAPYLSFLQDEADLLPDERITRMVKDNLTIVGSLLRTYRRLVGQWPLTGDEPLEPLEIDPKKGPNRPMTFEECCRASVGKPWQVNHIRGTDTERARRVFILPGEDPDKLTTSYEVVRCDNEKGVFVLRTPKLPSGQRLEATYRVTKRGDGQFSLTTEISEIQ